MREALEEILAWAVENKNYWLVGKIANLVYQLDGDEIPSAVTRTLMDIEKEKIVSELNRHDWNKKETAKVLGIAKSTLHEKINKYGLTKPVDE